MVQAVMFVGKLLLTSSNLASLIAACTVDANDRERIEEVKDELHLIGQEACMQGKPILGTRP